MIAKQWSAGKKGRRDMGLSLSINKRRGIGVIFASLTVFALGLQSLAAFGHVKVFAAPAPEVAAVEPTIWDGSNYKGINVDVAYKNISELQAITVSTLRADGSVVTKTAKQKLIDGVNVAGSATFTAPIVFQELSYVEADSGSWNMPSTTVWTKNTAPTKVTVKLQTASGVAERTSDVNMAGKNYITLLPADTTAPTSTLVVPVGVVGNKFTVTGVAKDNSDLNRVYVQLVDRKNGGRFGGQTVNLIGKGTEAAWTATFDASAMGMKDSDYAAHVAVTDMAGNTGANGWSADFKVDLTAPTVTIAAPTGVVGRQFTITGTASDNYSLNRVYVQLVNRQNSQRYAGTTIHLIGKGTAADWSYVVNAKDLGLPDGDYAAHVAATDMVGNTGTAGWTADFTVDSTGPMVTLNADREVNPKNATVKVADNLMLGNAYIDLYKNKVVNGVDQVDYSTKFTTWCSASFSGSKTGEKTCNIPAISESGVYWLKANGFDKQGNSEAVNAQYVKFTVDKAGPAVSIAPLDQSTNPSAVTATAQDASGVASMMFHLFGDTNGSYDLTKNFGYMCTRFGLSGTSVDQTCDVPTDLLNGTYWVRVIAVDKLGNNSAGSPVYVKMIINSVKDTFTPPAPVVPEPTDGSTPAPAEGGQAQTGTGSQATLSTPLYNGAVLGVNTDTDATDTEEQPVVAQNNTANTERETKTGEVLAAQTENTGSPWKLLTDFWYLWVLALAALAWWIIAAVRRKREDDHYFAN